jgi:hypothetical protein
MRIHVCICVYAYAHVYAYTCTIRIPKSGPSEASAAADLIVTNSAGTTPRSHSHSTPSTCMYACLDKRMYVARSGSFCYHCSSKLFKKLNISGTCMFMYAYACVHTCIVVVFLCYVSKPFTQHLTCLDVHVCMHVSMYTCVVFSCVYICALFSRSAFRKLCNQSSRS